MKNNKKEIGLLKKKRVMLLFMAVLLGVTGYVNFTYKNQETDETAKVLGEAQYVSTNEQVETTKTDILKMEREEARDKAKTLLEDVIKGEGYSEEAKKEAEQKLLAISDYIRIENDIETLVENKGFENVVTYNENGIVVAVMKDELLNTEIAKITEIIVSQTNLTSDKIKITTSN